MWSTHKMSKAKNSNAETKLLLFQTKGTTLRDHLMNYDTQTNIIYIYRLNFTCLKRKVGLNTDSELDRLGIPE